MQRTFARHRYEAKPETLRMNVAISDEDLVGAFEPEVLDARQVSSIVNQAVSTLPMRAALDPNDPAILEDLQRIACGAAGVFALNDYPAGHEFTITAPNKQWRRAVSAGPRSSAAHMLSWERGFYAALAAREREATEVLTQVTAETLRRGETKNPEWGYLIFEAMKSFARKRDDTGPKLEAAMKATDPDTCDPSYKNWVLDVAWPVLELAWNAYFRDQNGFDEAMWKALEGHKHYYSRAEGKRDIMGMIALRPLAMAVWAKDLGITTSVESDYIPRWIIDR